MDKEREDFRKRILMSLDSVFWDLGTWHPFALELQKRTAIKYEKGFYEDLSSGEGIELISLRFFLQDKSFFEFLEVLEQLIASLKNALKNPEVKANLYEPKKTERQYRTRVKWLVKEIEDSISCARAGLGIRFDSKEEIFYPSGDKDLEERLVKEPLRDLDTLGREEVSKVWKRGLRALLKSQGDHDELKDVVRDAYEALEAFAKIVCNNDRDLSGNRDRFISALNLNPYYQKMLKEYINYANEFRHAEKQQKPRPDLDYSEVEAFVYLTGLFIRLGIEKLRNHSP